ncbi:MAG: hypothetical protein ABIA37_00055 [Candidatus Woesearchaeota archaeon]
MAWFKTPEEEIRERNPFYDSKKGEYNFEGFYQRPQERAIQNTSLMSSYVVDFISKREESLERKVEEERRELREAWMPKPGYKGHLVVDTQVPVIGEVKPQPKQLTFFPNFYPERKIEHYEPRLFVPPKKEDTVLLP